VNSYWNGFQSEYEIQGGQANAAMP
jgi:hypothetical protein